MQSTCHRSLKALSNNNYFIDNIYDLKEIFETIINMKEYKDRNFFFKKFLEKLMYSDLNHKTITNLISWILEIDDFPLKNRDKISFNEGKITCSIGSGKKGFKTMNISTPSLIVAATAGQYVAKPGSKASSSLTGSADLMRCLGINIDIPIIKMINILKNEKFAFFPIENLIPKFDNIYGGKFNEPNILSFALPAVLSPIKLGSIVYGLSHPSIETSALCLSKLGFKNALIVCSTHNGLHYIDEFSICGSIRVIEIDNYMVKEEIVINPKQLFNLPKYRIRDIAQGNSIKENVNYVIDILKGKGEKAREDLIAINSGAILYCSKAVNSILEGYYLSKDIIQSGKPYKKIKRIKKATNS